MTAKLPTIESFLDVIDPENKLKKDEVLSEILSVVLLQSTKKASEKLNSDARREVLDLIKPGSELKVLRVFEIFDAKQKGEELQKVIFSTIGEIHSDYMQTQLKALSPDRKKKVLEKFPDLESILQENYHLK